MHIFVAVTLLFYVFYFIVLFLMFNQGEGAFDETGHILGRDFINYWTASVLIHGDRLMEIFDLGLFHDMQEQLLDRPYRFHMWSYPPTAIFAILPFGSMPYLWAFALWMAVTLALYLFAARCLGASGGETAVLALAPSSFLNFIAGQNGFLTAGLLVSGLALLDRRPWLAGIMFGLLSFKPQLGLLIPVALCAARLWRPFVSAAATSVALFAASVAAFGWDSWRAYMSVNAKFQLEMLQDALEVFVYWIPTGFMAGRLLEFDVATSYMLQAGPAIVAVAGVFWIYWKTDDRELQFAALLSGTVLATPYLHVYDLTLLSVAVIWAGRRGYRDGFFFGEKAILLLAWALPILTFFLNIFEVPVSPLIMLCFFLSILARARSVRAASPPPISAESIHATRAVQ